MWIVISGRLFPDVADSVAFGPFPTRGAAEEFMYSAHDEVSDDPHLWLSDVENGVEVLYVNPTTLG